MTSRLRNCASTLHPGAAYSHTCACSTIGRADAGGILRAQLAPFGGIDATRIVAHGPEVYLTPQTMQSLGLIMHELGTNATKHGAGRTVRLGHGRLDADSEIGVSTRLQERGPAGDGATRKGFVRSYSSGSGVARREISNRFFGRGLVCTVTIAANNLMSKGRHTHFPRFGSIRDPRENEGITQQINRL